MARARCPRSSVEAGQKCKDNTKRKENDDSDGSVMIKQLCAKSDVISSFVFRLSGMIDQLHLAFCLMLVSLLMKCDQTLNDVQEFETSDES